MIEKVRDASLLKIGEAWGEALESAMHQERWIFEASLEFADKDYMKMISVSHVFAVLQCVMAIFYRIFILLGACCYYSAWPLDLSLDCCSNRPMHSRWGS